MTTEHSKRSKAHKTIVSQFAMNMEWRERQLAAIQKLEGLLAYAVEHNMKEEAARIQTELSRLVEGL